MSFSTSKISERGCKLPINDTEEANKAADCASALPILQIRMPRPTSQQDDDAGPGTPLRSRRNLPRASHACQRCRATKTKCDQRQPCANCIKHAKECAYGIRRRNGRDLKSRTANSKPPHRLSDRHNDTEETLLRSDSIEGPPVSTRLASQPESPSVDNEDTVGDVNQDTHGTEFYGTSSNFVLLNQFFAYAQKQLPAGQPPWSNNDDEQGSRWAPGVTDPGRHHMHRPSVSIVNLLSSGEALEPPSRPKTPLQGEGQIRQQGSRTGRYTAESTNHIPLTAADDVASNRQRSANKNGISHSHYPAHVVPVGGTVSDSPLHVAKKRLEREYVRIFLSGLHHLHPMLDPIAFVERCEGIIWSVHTPPEKNKGLRHFFALYNIVVAVGALVAGSSISEDYERDIHACLKHLKQRQSGSLPLSSQILSRTYFQKSRALLGDVFEVCSLESAQTLLLMSLYCQNSLKPHACYMYCGHAVRTALAIGIARESTSSSVEDRKAARRTWWCIYSHEIDMSCSAGRRDSLGKPRNYQIGLPQIRGREMDAPDATELENRSFAMINEMVNFAAILRRISKELYHDSKGLSLAQKSSVAGELDTLLGDWKARLPEYLDLSGVSFREDEWAAKQKVVLHLRYLNARIVLHRPFLEPPRGHRRVPVSKHVTACLDAARKTLQVMHDAYTYRHYFRTWWYNSTYTLYAGMIILYIVMLGHFLSSAEELLADVMKAQDILQSMEEAVVARRSVKLIREGLQVARACIQDHQTQHMGPGGYGIALQSSGVQDPYGAGNDMGGDVSRLLFSHAGPGQGQDHALLASIIDPNLLQDFTAADPENVSPESFVFPFDGLFGNGHSFDIAPMPL